MSDIDKLIKNSTFDIISIFTIWRVIYSFNFSSDINFKAFYNDINFSINYSSFYPKIIGLGTSFYILSKYY
jgi:hypothetical protein